MNVSPSPTTIWFSSPTAPPLSAGPVTVQNGHLAVNGQRVTFFAVNIDFSAILSLLNATKVSSATGASTVVYKLDPNQETVWSRQLDNLVTAGIRAVRIHGLDNQGQPNLFANPGPPPTTRQFDSAALSALDWFIAALEQRNLRYVLDLHYTRQLVPADAPPWPCPLFRECSTQAYLNAPVGLMNPWMFFDDGLMQLTREYCDNLLGHANQFTGTKIGAGPGLLAVVLENEQSLSKVAPWSFNAHPQVNAAFNADFANWCATQNITDARAGSIEHSQYAAWKETQVLGTYAVHVRTLTPALVIAGNYFGNGPYSMLVSLAAVGDAIDAHFYSYYSASDPGNGFLCGPAASPISAATTRSRFAAVLAGCSLAGPTGQRLPQFVTEWGPVCQYRPNAQDPPAERSQVLAAAVQAAIAQDVDFIALYSWAHSPVFSEGSPFWRPDVYDFRVDPVINAGLPAQVAAFHDISLRPGSTSSTEPSASVTLVPTNGIYGTMTKGTSGQTVYAQFGPYTYPALYAVPANKQVLMSAAPATTISTDNTVLMSVAPAETFGTDNVSQVAP
ncbi:MAG TPA: hypothetical protein VGP63_13530 [Planctomycetaceae bacterium]|jgi:hypothetical protein|nr:hypothetical protein [Planctomycetaceae bacterium]